MIHKKYDYDKTIKFLKEVANTTGKTTREDLMIAMTGSVLKSKEELNCFTSALSNLKVRKLLKHNIDLQRDEKGDYIIKNISQNLNEANEIKEDDKLTYNPVKVVAKTTKDTTLEALEKDNQKLFLEKEKLKEQYEILESQYKMLLSKEKEYKNIIQSFYALAITNNS